MKKVVFLDIDGVLNRAEVFDPEFEAPLVARLNRVTDATGAVIVVHSSWRYLYSLEALRARLNAEGVSGEVVDVTPKPRGHAKMSGYFQMDEGAWEEFAAGAPSRHERAISIWRWRQAHPEVADFVIFDDDAATAGDALDEPGRFIKTDANKGLTDEHVERAIALLGGRP